MLIAFDVSNSRVGVGLFSGATLQLSLSLTTDLRRTADEYDALLGALLRERGVEHRCVSGAVIGSVVPPLTEAFSRLCTRAFNVAPYCIGAGAKTGVKIATHNPRELGTDRVVNAVAAYRLFGGPAIVVDFSTATSFDVIAADGSYAGSVIAPGLSLSADALFEHTSRLPRVELQRPRTTVGKDTTTALQSGLVLGHIAMVEGLLERIKLESHRNARVIATGELAPAFVHEISAIDHVEPHLTLIGLRLLYEMNRES